MNKVLIAFDGGNFSEGAFNFALRWHEHKKFLLTAVFLSSVDYATFLGYPLGMNSTFLMDMAEEDEKQTTKSIEHFKKICEVNNIDYRIHKDLGGKALSELARETRFADLLIIGSEKFYRNTDMDFPGEYLESVLHNAECPVLLVPENTEFPSRVILTYDGSASSVYAIKMFTYLFREMHSKFTTLVYASDKKETDIPYKVYIEEYAARHFNNLELFKLSVDPSKYFDEWTDIKEHSLVVAGSYGRSDVSETFKRSFITKIIAKHKLPVFIAHK
jgi:nucleotide-binding universal stress UspA family protein